MTAASADAPDAPDSARLISEAARRAATGLVVAGEQGVLWLNDAARALVEPHAGTWSGPGSPVAVLAGVRPGSRPTPIRWPSPAGGTRWWQVGAGRIAGGVLYEITDETDRYDEDGRDTGPPTAQWRLARLEAMTGQGSWVWSLPDATIEHSEVLASMFGVTAGDPLPVTTVLARYHPDDVDAVATVLNRSIRTGEPFRYVSRIFVDAECRNERVFECHGEVFRDASDRSTRIMGTLRDITEQHRDRTELAYLADHDPLTGAVNRRRINAGLAECVADARGAALLLIDIDNFKDINDLRGHLTGDRIIRRVAATVREVLGPDVLLGRLGGDEFAVLVPACAPAAAVALAERLRHAVASSADPALPLTISVGVAVVEPGQNPEISLAQADLALYAAKAAGRNRVQLYTPDHYRDAAHRVSVLQRVAAALDQGTMQLDAQPIVDLATGRVVRHEVLIRLRDGIEPALGPGDFLPAAERTDLVLEIDRWVLRRTVEALATPVARAADLRLDANLSARSLESADLGAWVLDLLATADVEPSRLGLEITETAAISSLDAARSLAVLLTDAGCGIALDDFGAGYGSFTYLKHLPFTAVKIAGDFVRRLDSDRIDRALVAGVVGVAQQLGMRTVAEEVSREELVSAVRTLGVTDAQGFHLGRPSPLSLLTGPQSESSGSMRPLRLRRSTTLRTPPG